METNLEIKGDWSKAREVLICRSIFLDIPKEAMVRKRERSVSISLRIYRFTKALGEFGSHPFVLAQLVERLFRTMPDFMARHCKLTDIYDLDSSGRKREEAISVTMDETVWAFIQLSYELDFSLRKYLDFVFSESESNKAEKERDIDNLMKICMLQIKEPSLIGDKLGRKQEN